MEAEGEARLFAGPTAVILIGSDRPLLNWVAYALAAVTDPGFFWVDVRTQGEVLSDSDPLVRKVIPPDRLTLVRSSELAPNNSKANLAVSAVVRDSETPANLQLLLDFLRLPERTQAVLSGTAPGGRPRVAVLSNAHRLGPLYPAGTVGPFLRAIRAAGVTAIMTFADAPNDGRLAFDVILHLEGHDPKNWKQAKLAVEKGLSNGPLRTGREYRLGDLDAVAALLTERLG